MVSRVQGSSGVPATCTTASTGPATGVNVQPSSILAGPSQVVAGGLFVSASVAHPPDILATSPRPPAPHPEGDRSHGTPVSVPPPHPYPGVASHYTRAPVPVTDPLLAGSLLQALYPALHGPTLPSPTHPAMVAQGPGSTNIGTPPSYHLHTADATVGVNQVGLGGEALPDIVHSHNVGHALPPRPNQHRSGTGPAAARHHRTRQHRSQTHSHSRTNREGGGRSGTRRGRARAHSTTSSTNTDEGRCKEPCVKCMVTVTSFRWVLVVLSLLGVLCVVTGIVLAALHAAGNSFLFLAIMFIGLGVLLVIVVAVGWKCTPRGHEPLHALFSIGEFRHGRRERRTHRHRHRDGNWHGGLMYPEFQYRRPPPTYAASMQEYNSQLALAQANNNNTTANTSGEDYSLPGSPPPSYRSRASTIHSGVHITFPPGHDSAPNSRPPTYRSRADSHQRPRLPLEEMNGAVGGTAPADVAFTGPLMNADTVQQIIGTSRTHRRQGSSNAGVWHTRSASADLMLGTDVRQHRRSTSLDRLTALGSSQGPHGPSPLTITQNDVSGSSGTGSAQNGGGASAVSGSATHSGSVAQNQNTSAHRENSSAPEGSTAVPSASNGNDVAHSGNVVTHSGQVAAHSRDAVTHSGNVETQTRDVVTHSTEAGNNLVTVRVAHTPGNVLHQNMDRAGQQTGVSQAATASMRERGRRGEDRTGVTSVKVNTSERSAEAEDEPEQYNTAL